MMLCHDTQPYMCDFGGFAILSCIAIIINDLFGDSKEPV